MSKPMGVCGCRTFLSLEGRGRPHSQYRISHDASFPISDARHHPDVIGALDAKSMSISHSRIQYCAPVEK